MFRPLSDNVLIRIEPPRAPSGLIVRVGDPAILTGIVCAVGPGKWDPKVCAVQPTDLSEGDRVAFALVHLKHRVGKQLTSTLKGVLGQNEYTEVGSMQTYRVDESDYALLHVRDIFMVLGPEVVIEDANRSHVLCAWSCPFPMARTV